MKIHYDFHFAFLSIVTEILFKLTFEMNVDGKKTNALCRGAGMTYSFVFAESSGKKNPLDIKVYKQSTRMLLARKLYILWNENKTHFICV